MAAKQQWSRTWAAVKQQWNGREAAVKRQWSCSETAVKRQWSCRETAVLLLLIDSQHPAISVMLLLLEYGNLPKYSSVSDSSDSGHCEAPHWVALTGWNMSIKFFLEKTCHNCTVVWWGSSLVLFFFENIRCSSIRWKSALPNTRVTRLSVEIYWVETRMQYSVQYLQRTSIKAVLCGAIR